MTDDHKSYETADPVFEFAARSPEAQRAATEFCAGDRDLAKALYEPGCLQIHGSGVPGRYDREHFNLYTLFDYYEADFRELIAHLPQYSDHEKDLIARWLASGPEQDEAIPDIAALEVWARERS